MKFIVVTIATFFSFFLSNISMALTEIEKAELLLNEVKQYQCHDTHFKYSTDFESDQSNQASRILEMNDRIYAECADESSQKALNFLEGEFFKGCPHTYDYYVRQLGLKNDLKNRNTLKASEYILNNKDIVTKHCVWHADEDKN